MTQERKTAPLFELEPRPLILALIAIPVTLLGSLFIISSIRAELKESVSTNLTEVAANTARSLESLILHDVTNVSVMAVTPSVVEAVITANRQHPSDFEVVRERLLALDHEWQRVGGTTALALEIIGRDTSEFLRQVEAFNPAYKEILLTDERGAVVAATNLTTDYLQADEQWWQEAYGDGESGSIFVSNVLFDDSAGAYAIEVVVPVREKSGENGTWVVGILKALIAASDLFSVVGAVQAGDSGHAVLVNASDGTIIIGDDPEEPTKKKFPGFVLLEEALGEGHSSFVYQNEEGRTWQVGFARMPQPSPFPELKWYVLVEQLLEEAQAPTRHATVYLLLFFGGMVLTVVFFSLYTHFKVLRPIRELSIREEMKRLAAADSGGTGS